MEIRRLNVKEIKQLYKECLKRDFPRNELRPLGMIKRLCKKNKYAVYGAYCDNNLAGYATIFMAENVSCVLLDYFAVQPWLRGCGTGSEFIKKLICIAKKEFKGKKLLIIECENPKFAESNTERKTRERRISFYKRNGAEVTNFDWSAFGVDFKLLTIPLSNEKYSNINVGEMVYNLYLQGLNPLFRLKAKKILKWSV